MNDRSRRMACLAAMCGLAWATARVIAQAEPAQPSVQQLQEEVARLRETVAKLEGVVEGTAQPVNLGRTSLARVTASSVNGGRAMDSRYYGVLNAFDGGENWHNNINYTHWLADRTGNWVEAVFEPPVTISAVRAENGPPFHVTVCFAKGGERREQAADGAVRFGELLHGVNRVRLSFADGDQNTRVDEIVILGYAPPGVEYQVGTPRVLPTEANAKFLARDKFDEWRASLTAGASPQVKEQDDCFVVTYRQGDSDLLRVIVDKTTVTPTVTPLVKLVPAATSQ